MIIYVRDGNLEEGIKLWKKKMRALAINSEIAFRERFPSLGERARAKRHMAWKRSKRKDKRVRAKF